MQVLRVGACKDLSWQIPKESTQDSGTQRYPPAVSLRFSFTSLLMRLQLSLQMWAQVERTEPVREAGGRTTAVLEIQQPQTHTQASVVCSGKLHITRAWWDLVHGPY